MKLRKGPSGLHAFSRRSGLNVLFDEIQVPADQWSIAPRQVSVALTNACDLACCFCYAPKYGAKLSYDRVVGWLDELDRAGCLGIGFGGGEPTLHHDFVRMCQFASEHTDLAVTFTTHGHHLDEQLAGALKGHVHFIRVSMDGIGLTYEMLRSRSFDRFKRQLELIRTISRFGINFVVNSTTFPDVEAATMLATQFDASEFLFLPERSTSTRTGIDTKTSEALCAWVRDCRRGIRLAVSEADAAGMPTCDPLADEPGLRSYAHIDAAGVLKRSSFEEAGVPIGEAGMAEALQRLSQVARRPQ